MASGSASGSASATIDASDDEGLVTDLEKHQHKVQDIGVVVATWQFPANKDTEAFISQVEALKVRVCHVLSLLDYAADGNRVSGIDGTVSELEEDFVAIRDIARRFPQNAPILRIPSTPSDDDMEDAMHDSQSELN